MKRRSTRYILISIISLCETAMLSGCFTGVESTPRISESEVRKATSVIPTEDSEISAVVDSVRRIPIRAGIPMLVTDKKVSLVLDPPAAASEISEGDTLLLQDITTATTLDGRQVAELHLYGPSGSAIAYRTTLAPDALKNISDIDIPFCIPVDMVDALRNLLVGKQYYITTSSRIDDRNQQFSGRRFVPVEITAVTPGNYYYPVRLSLTDDLHQQFHLFITVDPDSKLPRKFASQLTRENPRLRYPAITDDVWQKIINGTVATGMTRDECRLALGAPDNVDRQPGYSSVREIWTFKNGRYLVFIDGLLDSFRI